MLFEGISKHEAGEWIVRLLARYKEAFTKNNFKETVRCRNEIYYVHQKTGYFMLRRSGNGSKTILIYVKNTYVGTRNLRSGSRYVTKRVRM
jgi:hypothetical protein